MGISRDSRHKRSATGAKRPQYRKKRKFELGRQSAQTKIGGKRIHVIRVRGGNLKHRALRLETGNFSWGTMAMSSKCRIIRVVYNASNNELVRTNTLVKGAIVEIDAAPLKVWYENHFGQTLGKKKAHSTETLVEKTQSAHVQKKLAARSEQAIVDPHLVDEFNTGRVLARLSSRPGQSGRADGVLLEGKELEFYVKKIKSRKA